MKAGPRVLFYSPDSYGLGHVRRTIAIAERVLEEFAEGSALVLTGAPRAHWFAYPPRCDYLKLPSVTKGEDGRYACLDLDLTLEETVRMRSRLIQEAAASFRPDVLLVDHNPIGLLGEAVPVLDDMAASHPGALRILGLRDVLDEPEAVLAVWRRDRVFEVLRRRYDLVLVYGQPDFFDPIRSYRFPADVAAKTRFVGYIGRNGGRTDPDEVRRGFAPRTGRLVVLTVGGGGDGNLLVRAFLEAVEGLGPEPPFESVVVTGPLMSPRKRERFRQWAARLDGVHLIEHAEDMPGLFRAADFVVAMGGYNTVAELAYVGARAVLVPRTFPRKEQLLRARRLEERGVASVLLPEEATPDRLARECLKGLERERPRRRWGLAFTGLDQVAALLARQLGRRADRAASRGNVS